MQRLLLRFGIRIMLLGIFGVLLPACTDLDEELFDRVTPEEYYQSGESFFLTMAPVYQRLTIYNDYGGIFGLQEVSSDEGAIPARGNQWSDGTWVRLHRHEPFAEDWVISQAWRGCYGAIEEINRLIIQFEEKNDPLAEPYLAELKTLRALFYYWLMDLYGNIPIYFETNSDAPQAASPRADVFAFIESEILTNLDGLSKEVGGAFYGRMNYYAAQALLANLYLNADVYTGIPQWEKAATACAEIINSGQFGLEENYFNNFAVDNESSREMILAIPHGNLPFNNFNLHMVSLHSESRHTFELKFSPWNGFCSLSEFYHSFDTSDVRIKNFLAGPQFDINGDTLFDPQFQNPGDPDGPMLNFTPELNELSPNCYLQAGTRLGKFELEPNADLNLENDFPIFRYADIVLMRAEALWRLNSGDTEALALVNEIRNRAGMSGFSEITDENLLAERGREMAFEAKRRTDLIRFGKFGATWDFKEISEPCKTLFPIPYFHLQANHLLEQNPCY